METLGKNILSYSFFTDYYGENIALLHLFLPLLRPITPPILYRLKPLDVNLSAKLVYFGLFYIYTCTNLSFRQIVVETLGKIY